jgi:hypothetical protein
MLPHRYFTIFVLATHATAAMAQSSPATEPPQAAAPPGESTFEPEHVGGAKPAAPSTGAPGDDGAMTLDRLVITSTNRLDLNFFGDVSLQQLKDEKAGAAVGALGFQLTAHLAEGLVARTEFAMEFENGETVVDVERAYLEYRTNHWMIAAGRTHAELGYWNTAFHHGRWLQLTIDRPRVLRFEDDGGVLQIHAVGVDVAYGPARGDSGLEVAVAVSNGSGPTLVGIQTNHDDNWAKSLLVRIGAVGIGHPALRFGINIGVDSIAPEDASVRPLLPDQSIFEVVTGAYLALRSEGLILFSEAYNILHHGGGKTWQFTDGFVVAGYRFGRFIPYAEFEARQGDGLSDPYLNPSPVASPESVPPANFVEGTAGLRYDLSSWSALKLELAANRFDVAMDPARSVTGYRAALNWSFGR